MFDDDPKHINQKKFFLSPKNILASIKAITEKCVHYCNRNSCYLGNQKFEEFLYLLHFTLNGGQGYAIRAFNHCFKIVLKPFHAFWDFVLLRKSLRKTSHKK